MKCGSLNLLEPSGPVQACTRTDELLVYWNVILRKSGGNLSKFLTTVVPRAFYYEKRGIKYPTMPAKFYQHTRRRNSEVGIGCVHRREDLVSVP